MCESNESESIIPSNEAAGCFHNWTALNGTNILTISQNRIQDFEQRNLRYTRQQLTHSGDALVGDTRCQRGTPLGKFLELVANFASQSLGIVGIVVADSLLKQIRVNPKWQSRNTTMSGAHGQQMCS